VSKNDAVTAAYQSRAGAPPSVSRTFDQLDEENPASREKPRIPRDQSRKFWYESSATPSSGLAPFSQQTTRRSGSGMGSGRSRAAWTTLKIALVAPIDSASVTMAAAA
jgi:hypothetical protein